MGNHLIAPSILAADFGNLKADLEMVNNSEADWLHIDVMEISRHTKKPLDVHLMIVKPERYIKTFADLGSNILTVHYEACTHLHRTIQEIKDNGMKAGVAINPHTKVDLLSDIISDIDLVCLMSVNPGFGGQSFIESTYRKVSKLKQIITNANSNCKIEIDGGVSDKNVKKLLEKGADVLVAGNHVFKSDNPTETIAKLKNL